jgi:hypothetical protein
MLSHEVKHTLEVLTHPEYGHHSSTKPPKLTAQEAFDLFDAAHAEIWGLFKFYSLEILNAGRERYGAKGIIERIRWHTSVSGGMDFKINNNHAPFYARKLAAEDKRFESFFEFREQKTT